MNPIKSRAEDSTRRIFRDRSEAGQVLAELLAHYRGRGEVIVLGLPRGGIPVAWEVAAALNAPLDALVVRKLGVPDSPEFAFGALSAGGRVVLADDVVRALRLTSEQMRAVAATEATELARREAAYRGDRGPLDLTGRTVIVVDDGLATGASMFAAIEAIRDQEPDRIVVAVPAAPESTCRELGAMVDDVVCATIPSPFRAVGASYWDFDQVTDEQVQTLLATPTTGAPATDPAATIRASAIPAPGGMPPIGHLDDLIGTASIVLIGESTHGTHEFYSARAEMTKWLIEHRGFGAVAIEGDWPDAARVHRYVHGRGSDTSAEEALRGFQRFPAWMWRNTVVRDFVGWLREHNDGQVRNDEPTTGFFGLDLYSLHRSMEEVVRYLERTDRAAAQRAKVRYSCFDHADSDDGQAYGYGAAFGAGRTCEDQVVAQLVELQRRSLAEFGAGTDAAESLFDTLRNAWSVRDAELYYRTMFGDHTASWNLRDEHMADTLDALREHLRDSRGGASNGHAPKIVVWAHNSHVGDARATEFGAEGQLTIGQLMRQRHGAHCRTIGWSTYDGSVTAAQNWGGAAVHERIRPALPSSLEALLHDTGVGEFMVRNDTDDATAGELDQPRLQRAIGVVYRPGTERQSHYFHTRAAAQFDAIIHIDRTTALQPLEPTSRWSAARTPETYPTGL
ncbi:erythromycin esterase family protein [Nocardia neocaledoniensis]|uniref:erythromycin esterase family protein n=1 Tax=Nocardia neocaledoniensis TaxID=236511 RepID=UPI002456BB53|nr:erythromycin esterase family protein [Nocardia neocaledoniensis]